MKKTFTRKVINGRKYQFLTLPGSNLFKFELVNMYGSNIERTIDHKNLFGIAHFIEHLGFRAPKDYTTDELMRVIKEQGSYNASTNHDRINYWFKTIAEKRDLAVNLVCNYALNDLKSIPSDEFELEKKVVYNEAKRYADDDQTMFYFNMATTACGYHEEDNVIGVPSTIDTFTHEDTIAVKHLMLANGEMIFNVVYDPNVDKEDDIVTAIETELQRHNLPTEKDAYTDELYYDKMKAVRLGEFKVSNESEQAMTAIYLDTIGDNIFAARLANAYVSRMAETSLTDVIREKNGLTYGVSFGDDMVNYKQYTYFACDVSRGDEELLVTLFKDSIKQSIEQYDEEKHNKLIETMRLQRTLKYLNLSNYDSLFWLGIWFSENIDADPELARHFETDIDSALKYNDDTMCSYQNVKDYMGRLLDTVENEKWTKVYS